MGNQDLGMGGVKNRTQMAMSSNNIEEISHEGIKMNVSTEFYSRDAILEAMYRFTEKCYIDVSAKGEKTVQVHFIPKQEGIELNTIAKDFLNELIDQQLRYRIRCETQGIQERIIREAFAPLENVPKSDNE